MQDDDFDFNAEEFRRLSKTERVRLCRKFAAQARKQADAARGENQTIYRAIAAEWDKLAEEIGRSDGTG